jgi:ribose-phosphate pyrophosphokinase
MIQIADLDLTVEHFPDGTQRLNLSFMEPASWDVVNILWKYEKDEECMTLKYVVDTLKSMGIKSYLVMPYIPNARMDRIKSKYEVFTLKIFANFINSLNFESVYVLDPHSDVSVALIDRVVKLDPNQYIITAINRIADDGDKNLSMIYFPDAGAMKRYSEMLKTDAWCFEKYKYLYGHKEREWATGKIKGLKIFDSNNKQISEGDLHGESILMIDDIISYGGSMYYSANELKKCGAGNIYAYATHVENSVLDKENGLLLNLMEEDPKIVKKLYTTNSIYTGDNENISVINN